MSNFNLNALQIQFTNPWWFFLLIPLIALALFPFFRLPRSHRRTRNRIISLVLHLLIVTMGVTLLCGMTFHTEEVLTTFDAVIVVDSSNSNTENKKSMDEYIDRILKEEAAPNFNIGIVMFGHDQITVSGLSTNPEGVYKDYIGSTKQPDGSATDVAAALNYAKGIIKEKRHARIILLSDGLETDGDGAAAASALAQEGITVSAVYFGASEAQNELQIDRVEVGSNASVGGATTISVYLHGTGTDSARLTVWDNDVQIGEKTVAVHGGVEKQEFDYTFSSSGLHEIKATLEAGNDKIQENNIACAYVDFETSDKVLIVDGTGDQSKNFEKLLTDNTYDVTVVSPQNVPADVYALNEYSRVILMNVNMADIPYPDYDVVLESYVSEYGGGLLTTGGTNTYALGGMADTAFEDMLPVQIVDEGEPVLEVMIVLDLSNSMGKPMYETGNTKTRLDVAKEGIQACLETLNDTDYVGVAWFNAGAETIVPITAATNRDEIMERVNALRAPDGPSGTRYNQGLMAAQSELFNSKNNADKQHVIFLTDGKPQDDYSSTLTSMRQRGITVSTVAIYDPQGGLHGTVDDMNPGDIPGLEAAVKKMATDGGGNCYFTTNGDGLAEAMRTETELAKRDLVDTKGGVPSMMDYSPVQDNAEKLRKVNGYITSKPKYGAVVPFTIGDCPLYAEWNYGAGYVGSFMSDLGNNWASGYLITTAKAERTFLLNVVQQMSPPQEEMGIEFGKGNFSPLVTVKREVQEGHTVKVTVVSPAGKSSTVTLEAQGDCYSGRISTPSFGIYSVTVEEFDENNARVARQTVYTAFSYSYEYDAFRDPNDGFTILSAIVDKDHGGGGLLDKNAQIFAAESLTVTNDYDPLLVFSILLIVMFLLDIAVRKFKFKWIHEIVRDRREKKNERNQAKE